MAERGDLKSRWRMALIGLAVLLPAGPISASEQHTTLTIGVQQFPNTLNPNTDSLAIKDYVLAAARPDITTFDKDWRLVCYLCTALPGIEAGTAHVETDADGKKHIVETYTLQPDAKWDDGVPVSTDDVLFSFEVGKYPKNGYAEAQLFQGDLPSTIESVVAVDDKSFTIRLKGAPCEYQAVNDFRLLPAHVERPIFETDPEMYRLHSMYDTDPTHPGLYYGPYKVTKIVRGSMIELSRNDSWWGKRPAFDKVRIEVFENTSTMQSALVSGQVDYLPGEVGIPENIAASIGQRYGDRFDVVFKPSLVDQHIDLDLDNPALKNVAVRRALLLGIDRQKIDKALFDGQYQIENSFVDPLDSVYSGDVATYTYDPAQANTLLDQAGWATREKDGLRTNAAGDALSFTLQTTAGDRRREALEQALAWYWKQIGVGITIRNEPARILFGQTLPQRKFQGMALFSWETAPHNIPHSQYASSAIPTAANGYAGQNFVGWSNPRMDQLMNDMDTQCEPTANSQAWAEAQRLYSEELPSLPLFYRTDAFVIPKWLKGIEPTGHEYPSTMWIQHWYVGMK